MNPLKFMPLADAVAAFSKDTSTQVGALILGPAGEIRSTGWNGAPRGCSADEPGDRRGERPEKYQWFSHAELNAITNAARVGTPLDGCTMVVTHFPCVACCRAIIQAGIVSVVCPTPGGAFLGRWAGDISVSKAMFDECGVEVIET